MLSSECKNGKKQVRIDPKPMDIGDKQPKNGEDMKTGDNEKIRFKEVTGELSGNLKWKETFHEEEAVYFAEIKETESNKEICR